MANSIMGKVTKVARKDGQYGPYDGVTIYNSGTRVRAWFAEGDGHNLRVGDVVTVGYRRMESGRGLVFLKGAKAENVLRAEELAHVQRVATGKSCEGHPAGPYDPMGQTAFCDGTCR